MSSASEDLARDRERERLKTEAELLGRRMTKLNHALNLMGHSMSCGGDKTQEASYEELIDSFAMLTASWNARKELKFQGFTVAILEDDEDEDPCH